MIRTIYVHGVGRRHLFPGPDILSQQCAGAPFCRECNRERMEPYMADETKTKIIAVLREHLGPVANDLHHQDDIRVEAYPEIEWMPIVIALETEFGIRLNEVILRSCRTIDDFARLIDVMVESKNASPY